jgi:hypothetical protein
MTYLKNSKVKLLHHIYHELLQKPFSLLELKNLYALQGTPKSIRQIQRDLKEIVVLLKEGEQLESYFLENEKFYFISQAMPPVMHFDYSEYGMTTSFGLPILSTIEKSTFNIIKEALSVNKQLHIANLKYDETGDNFSFTTKAIQLVPVLLVTHRNNYFIGGYNLGHKTIVFYSIRQLSGVKMTSLKCNPNDYKAAVVKELRTRFGITKNRNSTVYTIKIEIASVLSNFIKNHTWHPSQQFEKRKGNLILTLECGINRELLGWLFQWMYNIKIIAPLDLKEYYEKVLAENATVSSSKKPLVYRNIFENLPFEQDV